LTDFEIIKFCDQIGNHLLKEAKYSKNKGIYWDHEYTNPENIIIDNGQSGILLFLIELFKATKNPVLINLVNESTEWIMSKLIQNKYQPGLFSGSFGTLYVIYQVYELTGNEKNLDYVLETLSVKKDVAQRNHGISYGTSGDILALLYFRNKNKTRFLSNKLEDLLYQLIKNATQSSFGTYWDDHTGVKNNLSFISGNLGIHFTLLKLRKAFKSDDLDSVISDSRKFLTDNCIKYRNQLSNVDKNYISILLDDHNLDFESEKSSAIKQLLKKDPLKLCSSNLIADGRSGIGLLHLEKYFASNNITHLDQARKIGELIISSIIKSCKYSNEFKYPYDDITFFRGISGIGYFLSIIVNTTTGRILENDDTIIAEKQINTKEISRYKLDEKLLTYLQKQKYNSFKLGLRQLPAIKIENLKNFKSFIGEKDRYNDYIISHIKDHIEQKSLFNDLRKIISGKLTFLNCLNENKPVSGKFQVNPYAIYFITESQDSILILKTSQGAKHFVINDLSQLIVKIIMNNTNLETQIKILKKKLVDSGDLIEDRKLHDFYMNQITEFIKSEIVHYHGQ
jgi:hypothetical protein